MSFVKQKRSRGLECVQEYRPAGYYWLGQKVLVYDIGRMRLWVYFKESLSG
jgi:hypothetical protein